MFQNDIEFLLRQKQRAEAIEAAAAGGVSLNRSFAEIELLPERKRVAEARIAELEKQLPRVIA